MALPLMIEQAMNVLVDQLRAQYNTNLLLVDSYWHPTDTEALNIETVDRYYISESIDTLQPPAVFLAADTSLHDLKGQNVLMQMHKILMGVVVEEIEIQRVTRQCWRYAQAAWLTLHDQNLADNVRVQVTEMVYGPTIFDRRATSGQRAYRKDVTLRLDVWHAEAFA